MSDLFCIDLLPPTQMVQAFYHIYTLSKPTYSPSQCSAIATRQVWPGLSWYMSNKFQRHTVRRRRRTVPIGAATGLGASADTLTRLAIVFYTRTKNIIFCHNNTKTKSTKSSFAGAARVADALAARAVFGACAQSKAQEKGRDDPDCARDLRHVSRFRLLYSVSAVCAFLRNFYYMRTQS